mgnify:CR=1 FL=1
MAAVSSTYTDPSDTFVWWIEGDKLAIATTDGDGGTTETSKGKYKAAIVGSGSDYITNGILISYYAEPDAVNRLCKRTFVIRCRSKSFRPKYVCYKSTNGTTIFG